ncbi:hypothetical protein [Cypionkella sp.]|uniref:hypothetical protein n=1 Tax=Cypionkella sp. TaxID=2811411 RepID=UPI002718CDBF|nr:hypothetical protein [Cypionkella sp.]MDO8985925.1 hypothetical protein [Cypionkella sp.]MDP2049908.1 hypothetical protein [Cypionkella sp.]
MTPPLREYEFFKPKHDVFATIEAPLAMWLSARLSFGKRIRFRIHVQVQPKRTRFVGLDFPLHAVLSVGRWLQKTRLASQRYEIMKFRRSVSHHRQELVSKNSSG